MKNTKLYNASMALVQAANFVKEVDYEFAQSLLDKAVEYQNQIVIDEELEAEVVDFEKRIKEG